MSQKFFKTRAFTLIELIMAMFLSACLMCGILQLFLTTKHIFEAQQGLARIQENARALDFLLSNTIAGAGNMGCNHLSSIPLIHIHENIPPLSAVKGLRNNQLLKRLVLDNDILWITFIKKSYPLGQETEKTPGYLILKGTPKFKENEIIAITDCNNIDIFKIRTASVGNKIIFEEEKKTVKLFNNYLEDSRIGKVNSQYYYIGNTHRSNASQYPIQALYQTDLNGRTLELIEGVEHLFLSFGVIMDKGIIFFPLEKIDDWSKVKIIRAKALLTSVEDALLKPQAYQLKDQTIIPSDLLMRRWWTFEWPIKGHG